jgi:hypothetical protein
MSSDVGFLGGFSFFFVATRASASPSVVDDGDARVDVIRVDGRADIALSDAFRLRTPRGFDADARGAHILVDAIVAWTPIALVACLASNARVPCARAAANALLSKNPRGDMSRERELWLGQR